MAKPIPVFSFVFAAYAATVAAPGFASAHAPMKPLQKADPFLNASRARSTGRGALLAKVGLLSGAPEGDFRFAARNSNEAFEELWLDEIAETRLGFIGAAVDGPALPLPIKPGQRMRFHRINVLDWRLEEGGQALRRRVRQDAREMLAELSKTVGH